MIQCALICYWVSGRLQRQVAVNDSPSCNHEALVLPSNCTFGAAPDGTETRLDGWKSASTDMIQPQGNWLNRWTTNVSTFFGITHQEANAVLMDTPSWMQHLPSSFESQQTETKRVACRRNATTGPKMGEKVARSSKSHTWDLAVPEKSSRRQSGTHPDPEDLKGFFFQVGFPGLLNPHHYFGHTQIWGNPNVGQGSKSTNCKAEALEVVSLARRLVA